MSESETLATKLSRLFKAVRREDGDRWTPAEVAEQVSEQGTSLSRSYLYELLSGRKADPSYAVIDGLASFFGVAVDYFRDDDRGRELNRQYETLANLGDGDALEIAHRASSLSPSGMRSVLDFIKFQESQNHGGQETSPG